MELTYHRKGDYLFPNLTVEEEEVTIGKYGMLRRTFLKEHKEQPVSEPVPDREAEQPSGTDRESSTGENGQPDGETAEKNPAPDKEADPMAWTAHMDALMATAEESILTELVYS